MNLRIDQDDRIALLGANGEGKSTFSKLLVGELPPVDGKLTKSSKLEILHFLMDSFGMDATAASLFVLLGGGGEKRSLSTLETLDRFLVTTVRFTCIGDRASIEALCFGLRFPILEEFFLELLLEQRAEQECLL